MKMLSERLEDEADYWDSWNIDHPDDGCLTTPPLLREAAELARGFEVAPVAVILGECNEYPSLHHIDPESWKDEEVIRTLYGNSVRIVPEKGG